MATSTRPAHIESLIDNVKEVLELMEMHAKLSGTGPGRKRNVEILNKSAIVLLTACWEAFVEDLCAATLEALVDRATDHTKLPATLVATIANRYTGVDMWKLAGDGWKTAAKDNMREALAKTTGKLNTPKAQQVDDLFQKALGLPKISDSWHWKGRTVASARKSVDDLVTLRGQIAHRVQHSNSVQKLEVTQAADLIGRLAEQCHNKARGFLHQQIGSYVWGAMTFRKKK